MKDKIVPLKCPTCGAKIPSGTLTCKYCGTNVILPKRTQEELRRKQEHEEFLYERMKGLIRNKYSIAEIYQAMEDTTRLLENARKLPNCVSARFVSPTDRLRHVTVEGKIVELGEREEIGYGWQQLATLRDDTGDIKLCLSDGLFRGDDAYKGDTVRVEHGFVLGEKGETVLYPTTSGSTVNWQISLNPKASIPRPSLEFVQQTLERIAEEPRYGRDAPKILKLLMESEQPIKYACHDEDLVTKSVNAGIDQYKVEKIINLLRVGNIDGSEITEEVYGYYFVEKYALSIGEKYKKGLWGSTIQHKTITGYRIRHNLRPHLPELL